jgi:copper homeostasis protein
MLGISRGEHMQNKQDLINKAATKITDFFSSVLLPPVHTAVLHNTGGAGRLELCSNLLLGGTTPSYGLVKMVKEQVHIPVHVLIRPRSGNFVFSCTELKVMIEDIKMVGQLGVQGVAIGVLTEDNKINVDQEDAGLAGALWSV